MDMDHDHDHDHGGGSASCPMIMSFHAGHCERILWNGWVASTVLQFVLSAFAIFVLAFLYEGLKFFREYLIRRGRENFADKQAAIRSNGSGGGSSSSPLADYRQQSYVQNICNSAHFVQTLLYTLQIIVSYLLMLIFMTFNYWLCLAVVLGLGLGYFFFGWIKKDAYETDCCS